MREEPLPHERLPGAMDEWRYDTVNNPKAVPRSQVAAQYAGPEPEQDVGGSLGVVGILVAPFLVGVVAVGLAFLPFFWIGLFLASAGWSFQATASLVCVPLLLWAAFLLRCRLVNRPTSGAARSSRRPYVYESTIRTFWRKAKRTFAYGQPMSLGDALTVAFAVVFAWLVFSGKGRELERVGPAKTPETHVMARVGLDLVNLPLAAVQSMERVAKGLPGLKTLSIPLFLVALNALFYASPLALVAWPVLRIVQRFRG